MGGREEISVSVREMLAGSKDRKKNTAQAEPGDRREVGNPPERERGRKKGRGPLAERRTKKSGGSVIRGKLKAKRTKSQGSGNEVFLLRGNVH